MKYKVLFGALLPLISSAALAVTPAVPSVTWVNNASNTKHVATFSDTPTTTAFVDQFTFNVTDAYDLVTNSKVTSKMSASSAGVSDIDFSSIVLSGGGKSYFLTQTGFDAHNGTETWSLLNPALLAHGAYTMTLTGSSTLNAKYSGNMTLVSSVPEPETYSMVLLGIGLVGFSARRRKSANFA